MNLDDRIRQLRDTTPAGQNSADPPSLDQITHRAQRSRTRDRAAFAAVGLALVTVTSVGAIRVAGTGQNVTMPVASAPGTTGQGGGSPGTLAPPRETTASFSCVAPAAPSVGEANGSGGLPDPVPSTSIGKVEPAGGKPGEITHFIGPDGETVTGEALAPGDLPATTVPLSDAVNGTASDEPAGPVATLAPDGSGPAAGQPLSEFPGVTVLGSVGDPVPCTPLPDGVPFPGPGLECGTGFNSGAIVPDGVEHRSGNAGFRSSGPGTPSSGNESGSGATGSGSGMVSSDSPISSDGSAPGCHGPNLSPTNPDGSPNLGYLLTRPPGEGPTFVFTPPSGYSIPGVSAYRAHSDGFGDGSCTDTLVAPLTPDPPSTTPDGLTLAPATGEPQVAMACIGPAVELTWGPFAEDAGVAYLFGPNSMFTVNSAAVDPPSGSDVDGSLTVERRCRVQAPEDCFVAIRWLRTDGTRMMLAERGGSLSQEQLVTLVSTVRPADAQAPMVLPGPGTAGSGGAAESPEPTLITSTS